MKKKCKESNFSVKMIRRIIIFLLIQISIILLFLSILKQHAPIEPEEIKVDVITVQDSIYYYGISGDPMYNVVFNSNEYSFSKFPVLGTDEYSMSELKDAIDIGDELSVEYIVIKDTYEIIDAYNITKNIQLRSKEALTAFLREQYVIGIATFAIVETLFLLTSAFVFWLCLKLGMPVKHKKSKQ